MFICRATRTLFAFGSLAWLKRPAIKDGRRLAFNNLTAKVLVMLRRLFIGLATGFGLFMLFLVTVVANARFSMPHPRDQKMKMLITDRGAVLMPPEKISASGRVQAVGTPKAEVVESVYHFGRMDPHAIGKHSFQVRNTGTAPLRLNVAGTTCKCTVGGASANEVPPGGQAFVTLEWNTGFRLQNYSQSAEVRTNDPLKPSFTLEVKGKVRLLFGAEQEELVVPPITPGKPASAEVVLFSQIWDELEILAVKTTLPGMAAQFLPVDSGEARRLEAKSARLLRVTVPGDLPQGEFRDVVRIKAAPKGSLHEVADFELPLLGKTLRRLAIHGPFTEGDALRIGQVPRGAGKTMRLTMKLRDEDLSLPITSIEVQPSFLKVTVEPHKEAERPIAGLYDLVIEVPADAPPCQYMGNPMGSLLINTGHPRVPEVKLQLLLAVTP